MKKTVARDSEWAAMAGQSRRDATEPPAPTEIPEPLAPATDAIPGLPPGLRIVRYGMGQAGEFFFEHGLLYKLGPQARPGFIAEPLPGWEFAYEVQTNQYMPVQKLPSRKQFRATFEVSNEKQVDLVNQLQGHPCLVSFQELPAE